HKLFQVIGELLLKLRVVSGLFIMLGQLPERIHQGFRHVPPAIGTEATVDIGDRRLHGFPLNDRPSSYLSWGGRPAQPAWCGFRAALIMAACRNYPRWRPWSANCARAWLVGASSGCASAANRSAAVGPWPGNRCWPVAR